MSFWVPERRPGPELLDGDGVPPSEAEESLADIEWVHRRLGLRLTDLRPEWSEILFHLVVWSVATEVIAPHFFVHATGDPWDVVAYASGALIAGLLWHRP